MIRELTSSVLFMLYFPIFGTKVDGNFYRNQFMWNQGQ